MLKLVSLSSGSCGNAIYLEAGRTKILIDAGTTLEYLGMNLANAGVRIDDLDAVLLTHEHSDHIRCAGSLSRRFGTKIMGNADTLDALPPAFGRANVRAFPVGEPFELRDIEIEAVPHSHDCRAPVGFVLRCEGKKICIATDLGRVTKPVEAALADADVIVLESNHDFGMLSRGRYPGRLKARIAGERGHLSNVAAGRALARLATGREQKVLLAHLSNDNNRPGIALKTVGDILAQENIESLKISVAPRLALSQVLTA